MNEETRLLVLLKKGNRDAFDTLFGKYSPKLYFFVLKTFRSRADAEEIVQETFLRIWETRREVDETRHFNTYLITIAKRIIYDRLRRMAVERRYNDHIRQSAAESYSIENELALKNLREYMAANIELLPAQQREILVLKSMGYENEEILNISKRTVETHINRAFRILRTYLADRKEVLLLLISATLP